MKLTKYLPGLRPLPITKIYIYTFLFLLTAILISLYSFHLEIKFSVHVPKQKYGADIKHIPTADFETIPPQIFQLKILRKENNSNNISELPLNSLIISKTQSTLSDMKYTYFTENAKENIFQSSKQLSYTSKMSSASIRNRIGEPKDISFTGNSEENIFYSPKQLSHMSKISPASIRHRIEDPKDISFTGNSEENIFYSPKQSSYMSKISPASIRNRIGEPKDISFKGNSAENLFQSPKQLSFMSQKSSASVFRSSFGEPKHISSTDDATENASSSSEQLSFIPENSPAPIIQSTNEELKKDNTLHEHEDDSTKSKYISSVEFLFRSFNKTEERNVNDNKLQRGYLVNSKKCKIPDIDPMDPSISKLVQMKKPLNCTEMEPITKTEGNWLILDLKAAERRGFTNFSCCYKSIQRRENSFMDHVYFGECQNFEDKIQIKDEFITVVCFNSTNVEIYREFHSFIHDKPEVEERCNYHTMPPYSVMIMGVDSVSRLNAHRQMNKTLNYLLNEMKAVEMFGFNKIGDNTFPNLVAMLLGYDERELNKVCYNTKDTFDKCNFLWKRFSEKGYRTLFAEDAPRISTFNYNKKGFYKQPTDYYFRPFISSYEEAIGWKKTHNCKLCVGSTSETEAILHWNELFLRQFKNRAYFSFSWINSATHDDVNGASTVDHLYEKFFRDLHESGALNRTIVILMSDHGMRWGRIRLTSIGRLEERLPMLFVALPLDFRMKYPNETEFLKINAQRLVTPFDLHATLLHVLHLEEDSSSSNMDNISEELVKNSTRRAASLFRTVSEDRSCEDAYIDKHWCTCKAFLSMDPEEKLLEILGEFLVRQINYLLEPVSDVCEKLILNSVKEATMQIPSNENTKLNDDATSIYTLTIQTSPSEAIFEGTVHITQPDYEFELLGTISRLTLYGNQSACVNDAILKKYCYCSDYKETE